jgi:hypothetical protein
MTINEIRARRGLGPLVKKKKQFDPFTLVAGIGCTVWILGVVAIIAFWIAVVLVAAHFTAKYW